MGTDDRRVIVAEEPEHARIGAVYRASTEAQLGGAGNLKVEVHPGTYKLPDGGSVEVTNATVVPMGDVWAYEQLTYTHPGNDSPGHRSRPACRIVFEVRNGVPICTTASLSSAGQITVRPKDFRALKLDELRSDVYAYVGVLVPNPDVPGQLMIRVGPGVSYREGREHVKQVTHRRRITPELLERVAKVCATAREGAQMEAVKAAFQVGDRQAWRYIAGARKAGLIDG
jgi:hypothetical protein